MGGGVFCGGKAKQRELVEPEQAGKAPPRLTPEQMPDGPDSSARFQHPAACLSLN
jgi:hypothetical protein